MTAQVARPANATAPAAVLGRIPEWSALSDRGQVRENNEDFWGAVGLGARLQMLEPVGGAALPLPANGVLFILSDGMGGARAGEEASRLGVERLSHELHARAGSVDENAALRAAFLATHAALVEAGRSDPAKKGMGATLSALWLRPGGTALVGHVGDSRIYQGREGRWRQVTDDHTLGEGLVRRGGLTPEAAARFRFRSLLEQAIGGDGRELEPQIATLDWRAGDAFALCSDGLYRPLEHGFETRLRAAAREAQLADGVRLLVEAANQAGGPDNITVLLVRATEGEGAR